jgi:hypothetical protein
VKGESTRLTKIESRLDMIESRRLTKIESRLDTIESRLDLILQWLPRPMDGWSNRIVALEHTVKESKEIWPVLDDVHHQQLSKIRGDITKLEEGIEVLKPEFCQGLDDVNIRVDGILERMGTHVPSSRDMSSSDSHRAEDSQPTEANIHLPQMNPIPPTSPPHPRQGVGLSPAVNPGRNETVHPTNNGQQWSYEDTEGVHPPRFSHVPGSTSFRPVSNPYNGERDTRNINAQRDPRRYTPPRNNHHPGRLRLSVDANTGDMDDLPRNGEA